MSERFFAFWFVGMVLYMVMFGLVSHYVFSDVPAQWVNEHWPRFALAFVDCATAGVVAFFMARSGGRRGD